MPLSPGQKAAAALAGAYVLMKDQEPGTATTKEGKPASLQPLPLVRHQATLKGLPQQTNLGSTSPIGVNPPPPGKATTLNQVFVGQLYQAPGTSNVGRRVETPHVQGQGRTGTTPSGVNAGTPHSWLIGSHTDIGDLAAFVAPVLIKLSSGALPDALDNVILQGIDSMQWASSAVRDSVLNDIATRVSRLRGLSNIGKPPFAPIGEDGPFAGPPFGPGDRRSHSRVFVSSSGDPNAILQELPKQPQPYVLECALARAWDAMNKALAKNKFSASVNPFEVLSQALKSITQRLSGQGMSLAQKALTGGKIDPSAEFGKALGGAINDLIGKALELVDKIFTGLQNEIDRRKMELHIVRQVESGIANILNRTKFTVSRGGNVNIPRNDEAMFAPVGSYSWLPSDHNDKMPKPFAGWAQVADRDLNFLGGLFPGPCPYAYATCLGGQYAFTSRVELKIASTDVERWLQHNRRYGLSVVA